MNQNTSLTQNTYETVRDDLIACRLAPGGRLKTNDLSKQMGVSLGIIREALARLTAEGFVVAEPQRGFRAAPVSSIELLELSEATIEIEEVCLRHSIRNGDVRWEGRVISARHMLARAQRSLKGKTLDEEFVAAYVEFRSSLISACNNTWLLRLRSTLDAQNQRYRQVCGEAGPDVVGTSAEFDELVRAVLAREEDAAVALLSKRLRENATRLAKALARKEHSRGAGTLRVKN